MITEWLLFITTFLTGYYLGRSSPHSSIDLPFKEPVAKLIKQINKPKPGIITSPSGQDIFLKENPKIKEEIEEQKKAFGELMK